MTTISAQEAARRFDRLANSLVSGLEKPVRGLMNDVVRDTQRDFEGMSLFSRSDAPELLLNTTNIRQVGGELNASIELRGMAAIVEEGGSTEAHQILATSGSVLTDVAGSFFAPHVAHPGSMFGARGFMQGAAKDADRSAGPGLDRAVQETIRKAGLA